MTLRSLVIGVRPRAELYEAIGLRSSRAAEILRGEDPGSTATLARLIGQYAVREKGREEAALIALTVLEELHPEAFPKPSHDAA